MDWCSHCLDVCTIQIVGDFRCCSTCGKVLSQSSTAKSVRLKLIKRRLKRSFILSQKKRKELIRLTQLYNRA
ncbi:hypothetical protein IC582_003221 [Cucumis melo]